MTEILDLDATAQLEALAARRISSAELLEAAVARAEALDPKLNALAARDLDRAKRRAQLLDEQRGRGEPPGRLAGLPLTIKDVLDVEFMPASSGRRENLKRPASDAAVVGRIRSQGAVIWAKTNVAPNASDWQTFNVVYGRTNNPWNLERTPGGSSGGAAAAIATGISALEVGSDNAGSLRAPASFCGVLSLQPTYGLAPQRGHVPPEPGSLSEPDLNVIGPIARSVRDLRLMGSVITSGHIAAEGRPAALAGLKVGLWLEEPSFFLDPAVKQVLEGFARSLEGEGAEVTPVHGPVAGDALLETYVWLLYSLPSGSGAPGTLTRLKNEAVRPWAKLARRGGLSPQSWAGCTLAATARHEEWLRADETRAGFKRTLKSWFEKRDVLIAPAAPVPAFPHDTRKRSKRKLKTSDGRSVPYEAMMHWSALSTVCGLPAVTLPAGSIDGLPVGVQLIGPRDGDSRLLAIAQAIEESLGGYRPPPPF